VAWHTAVCYALRDARSPRDQLEGGGIGIEGLRLRVLPRCMATRSWDRKSSWAASAIDISVLWLTDRCRCVVTDDRRGWGGLRGQLGRNPGARITTRLQRPRTPSRTSFRARPDSLALGCVMNQHAAACCDIACLLACIASLLTWMVEAHVDGLAEPHAASFTLGKALLPARGARPEMLPSHPPDVSFLDCKQQLMMLGIGVFLGGVSGLFTSARNGHACSPRLRRCGCGTRRR
jgi:hypothetical protein